MFQKKIIITGLCITSCLFAAQDYENFDLPNKPTIAIPESKINFGNERVRVKGGKVKLKAPSVGAQQLFFAKEAYLSAKRDEAIKLLRQELDTGHAGNRDNILLRLGQLYAEKYMELSYREGEVYSKLYGEYEKKLETNKNAQPPKIDNTRSQAYLKDALRVFYSLEKDYPNTPKIDEAIYFIGFVELENGNAPKGIAYLERVIKNYPKSRKYDEAILYLGDHFFENHKFKEAQQKYRLLLARQSGMQDYASYKLAWCELNVGSPAKALIDMKSLVTRLAGTGERSKFNLREQAVKDLVVFYGETDNVDDAINFLSDVQGRDKAMENLKLLADIYRSKGKDQPAIKAYIKLIEAFPNSIEAPKFYMGLYEAQSRLGQNAQAEKNLLSAVDKYGSQSEWSKSFPDNKRAEVQASQEVLGSEVEKIALFHHQAGQRSANKGHYEFAIKLYDALLRQFPNHPDKKKIAFFRGEALYTQAKYLEATDSYMIAAKLPPKDKMSDESVYNALLSLDALAGKAAKLERYSKEEQGKVSLTPEEIPDAEKRFIEVGQYYLEQYPNGDKVIDVKFRIAGIYYRRHHFDKAQEQFKAIALQHPKHRSATTAAHIVLDIDNIKKDYDSLQKTAQMFVAVPDLGDAEFRKELARIAGEIDFKKIEKFESGNQWDQAGDNYFDFYKKNSSSPLAEKSLYNAYVSYEKSGNVARSGEVARIFVAKFPKSEYSSKMLLSFARTAEKQYDYAQAQKLYLDFYRRYPKEKEARKAFYNAAVYAELLEQNKDALALYEEYLKKESPNAEEKKAINISQSKLYRKDGQWDKVNMTYRRLMRDAQNSEEKMGYLAELIRQNEKAGRLTDAKGLINELRYLAQGKKGVKGLAAQYLAEAEFNKVTPKREKYEQVKLAFPPDELVFTLKRKQKMLTSLADAYDGVVEFGVPEWGVAALFEKGVAYDNLVKNYRAVQIPKRYKDEERAEIEKALKNIDAQLVLPVEKKAQEFFRACVKRASDFKVVNEYSDKCRSRIKLAENEVYPEASGTLPLPVYWSTKIVIDEETSKKAADYSGSEAKIKAYLAENSDDKKAAFALAVHYAKVKKRELAQFILNQLENDKGFGWKSHVYNNLGMLALTDKNRLSAMDYLQKATAIEPVSSAPLVNLGALYLQSRSYKDAEKLFERATEIEPGFEDTWLGLGASLEGLGKYEEAHNVYAKHLEANPNALNVMFNDAIILGNRLKMRPEASEQMLRYIQRGGKESAKAHGILQSWR